MLIIFKVQNVLAKIFIKLYIRSIKVNSGQVAMCYLY